MQLTRSCGVISWFGGLRKKHRGWNDKKLTWVQIPSPSFVYQKHKLDLIILMIHT